MVGIRAELRRHCGRFFNQHYDTIHQILNQAFMVMSVLEHQQSAITWAKNYLTSKGLTIQGEPETIREVPWSCVHRIVTSIGFYYLKQIALPFAIETKLLPYLTRFYPTYLPHMPSNRITLL